MRGNHRCEKCSGTGLFYGDEVVPTVCLECDGFGIVEDEKR